MPKKGESNSKPEAQVPEFATVTTGVPDAEVEVNEDTTIVHEGEQYESGDKLTLPGPMAQNYAASGYVTIL